LTWADPYANRVLGAAGKGRLSRVSLPPLPPPEQMPTALLIRLALREIGEDPDRQKPFLVALHGRPERAVFDAAVGLLGHDQAPHRELGVRILRELGAEQDDGRRPFSAETIPVLRSRLRQEPDPRVLGWVISALGYHGARVALADILARAGHPDAWVRFSVAAALPSLVDPARIEPEAAEVLIRLCHDQDSETRFYALYAATQEVAGIDADALNALTGELLADPDGQIRAMAADHQAAADRPESGRPTSEGRGSATDQ
jgi:HEAT repeats